MKHWTFKRKFYDSVFTPKKEAKVVNVKTSAQLELFFFFMADPQPPCPPSPLVGVVLECHRWVNINNKKSSKEHIIKCLIIVFAKHLKRLVPLVLLLIL